MAEEIMRISQATQGRDTDWRGQQASLAFAKVGVTALTLLRVVPGSPHFGPVGKYAVWDLSAIVSLCRCLIESYYVLCYLRYEPTDADQKQFRQWLWEYHEQFERHEMLRTVLPGAQSLPSVKRELDGRRVRLEGSPIFKALSTGEQRELIEGKKFKRESAVELSRQAGISEKYYRAQYKYCSTFTHSAPFAISQLDAFRAGSDEANEVLKVPVSLAVAHSALAVRDFLTMFPDAAGGLNRSSQELIHFWEEIMKWENSSGFGPAADIVSKDPT
ncbi:MAG: DUF5677 domain-containing protein [Opitutaceae bacterium]|nr:DUF5677 domain-containing protein [Opitutaceae bacterium]